MPKMVFCQKSAVEYVKDAFDAINLEGKIVVFDDEKHNLEQFIEENHGTEVNFR